MTECRYIGSALWREKDMESRAKRSCITVTAG
jgi:hypothetical protein